MKHQPIIIMELNRGCMERSGRSRLHYYSLLDSLGYPQSRIELLVPGSDPNGEMVDIICRPKN